jgi:hypothetical protein
LEPITPERKAGVRVSGRLSGPATESQIIYLSGIAGDLFADGTFEVIGVPPGRHFIVTRDDTTNEPEFGGVVAVGDRDVDNVVLQELALKPAVTWQPSVALPSENRPAGSAPMAGISGTVVESVSHQPVTDGSVVLRSKSKDFLAYSFTVEAGRFDIRWLFPGTYDLELRIFGHETLKRTIEVGEQDIRIDLTPRKLP